MNKLRYFRDAGIGPADYDLKCQDVLRGLRIGLNLKWIDGSLQDKQTLNLEGEDQKKLAELDCSWVVPGQILACASPSDTKSSSYPSQSPHEMLKLFRQLDVGAVIRLNEPLYDAHSFEKAGIQVYDLQFPDGSCPSASIIQQFKTIVDKHLNSNSLKKGVAVHCRAGLGRTGTLIGCYLMEKYAIKDSKSLIAWMRLCRPGMVVGDQQHFLEEYCADLFQKSSDSEQTIKIKPTKKSKRVINDILDQSASSCSSNDKFSFKNEHVMGNK